MDIYAIKTGDLIEVTGLSKPQNILPDRSIMPKKKQKRGVIKSFSRGSKTRLKKVLHKLKKQNLLFVTLTYENNQTNNSISKSDLDNFSRAISKRNKKIWFIWKMEYQKRGAIHYHLILGGSNYKYVKKILNRLWKHGFTALKIARKRDLFYFSKYVLKDPNTAPDHSGRFWGIYNKPAIDFCIKKVIYLSQELEEFLRQIIQTKIKTQPKFSLNFYL